MTQYLYQQQLLSLLFWASVLGIAVGALYQICLIRRTAFDVMGIPKQLAVVWMNLEDFLVLLLVGGAVSILFYAKSYGVIRWMAIPALGAGLLFWRMTAGIWIDRCTHRILHLLAMLLRRIYVGLLSPLGRLLVRWGKGIGAAFAAVSRRRREKRLWRWAGKRNASLW